jgi:hypothetical protein
MPDGTTPNVQIFNSYDAGGTATYNAATGDIGNLGVRINRIPAAGETQSITFQVIGAIQGTNAIITDDYLRMASFDILNQAWAGSIRGLLIGTPGPLTLTNGLFNGGTGTCGGLLSATDLTNDAAVTGDPLKHAPDLGGGL